MRFRHLSVYFLCWIFFLTGLQAQTRQVTRQSLLEESRSNRAAGNLFLIGGSAIVIVSSVTIDRSDYFSSDSSPYVFFTVGLVSVLVGIPFLNKAAEQSRRASRISFDWKPNVFPEKFQVIQEFPKIQYRIGR